MRLRSGTLLLLLATRVAVGAEAEPSPRAVTSAAEIRVPRTTGAIVLDGKLDEADWQKAPRVVLRKLDGTEARHRTEARILHDVDCVYIAFKAEDPDIWTDHEARDSRMWKEDVVEVFFDVDPSDPLYVEIEVNPKGGLFDVMLLEHRGRSIRAWNPGIEVVVKVDGTVNQREDKDRSWTVEMVIPAIELAPVPLMRRSQPPIVTGTVWGTEFCRIDNSKGLEEELQSWTVVPNDFHRTEAYGRVVFE